MARVNKVRQSEINHRTRNYVTPAQLSALDNALIINRVGRINSSRKPYVNRQAVKRFYGVRRLYHRYCSECGVRVDVLKLSIGDNLCINCF